ncbi:MAG: SCO family protein [Anaeromyxobacteraceae bacterium]
MRRLAAITLAVLFSFPAAARAEDDPEGPAPLQGVEIQEQLNAQVPTGAAFLDQDGRPVRIADFLDKGKPVVLALVYYECPMLCGLILGGMARGMKETGLELGKDYTALSISFDPREKPAQGFVRQKHYLQSFDKADRKDVWPFLVGQEKDIRSVTDAVGFQYKFDEETKQYAHGAAILVLTPDGRVSRYLYGVEFPGRDLRLAIVEAGQGKVGTSFDRFLLTCYRYDPVARKYVPYAMGMVRAGALLVLFGLASALFVYWRREVKGARR